MVWAVAALSSFVFGACSAGRRASLGGECELNSDCDTPLVCRIGFCRNECATSEDCAAGLSCLLDEDRLGVCQLAEEASCTQASECHAPLVCRFNQCTNPCEEDRDCLGGARCRVDPLGNACIDPSSSPCVRDGECSADEYCLSGRCRQQCFTDRDCRRGWVCNTFDFAGKCEDPTVDAGPRPPRDGGIADTGDAATRDTGAPDAGVPRTTCLGGGPLSDVTTFDHDGRLGCAVVDGMTSGLMPGVYCWGQSNEEAFWGRAPGPITSNVGCATRLDFLGTIVWEEIVLIGSAGCVRQGSMVQCWGADDLGQIPDGLPGAPLPAPFVVGFAGGGVDRMFRGEAGGVFARGTTGMFLWGTSVNGHLGDGTTGTVRHDSLTVLPFPLPIEALASTSQFTCVSGPGDVACSPPTFRGTGAVLPGARSIGAGALHVCASDASSVYCWGGTNGHGELGTGDTVSTGARVLVSGLPTLGVLQVDAGGETSCALLADGAVHCWGAPTSIAPARGSLDFVLTPIEIMTQRTSVGVDREVTCGLGIDRRILCVGSGRSDFLGYGSGPLPTVPVLVQL